MNLERTKLTFASWYITSSNVSPYRKSANRNRLDGDSSNLLAWSESKHSDNQDALEGTAHPELYKSIILFETLPLYFSLGISFNCINGNDISLNAEFIDFSTNIIGFSVVVVDVVVVVVVEVLGRVIKLYS